MEILGMLIAFLIALLPTFVFILAIVALLKYIFKKRK